MSAHPEGELNALERFVWNAYQDQGHIEHDGWTYSQGAATCRCGVVLDLSGYTQTAREGR